MWGVVVAGSEAADICTHTYPGFHRRQADTYRASQAAATIKALAFHHCGNAHTHPGFRHFFLFLDT